MGRGPRQLVDATRADDINCGNGLVRSTHPKVICLKKRYVEDVTDVSACLRKGLSMTNAIHRHTICLGMMLATTLVADVRAEQPEDPEIEWNSGAEWPEPKVVDPGPPGKPPSDAVVLFDGEDLSAWKGADKWTVKEGEAICGGELISKQPFGDCQLHLEWLIPADVEGEGQDRCNSGVYLMGRYEVQILDSYKNKTYFDGQAGAVYKQRPPLVNASRKPGEWQTYDIIFKAPRFDDKGKLQQPAYITLLHNSVLVHDHFEIMGNTFWSKPPRYKAHPPKLPLKIQYHGAPIHFRNIWIRELEDDHAELLTPIREKLKQEQ